MATTTRDIANELVGHTLCELSTLVFDDKCKESEPTTRNDHKIVEARQDDHFVIIKDDSGRETQLWLQQACEMLDGKALDRQDIFPHATKFITRWIEKDRLRDYRK